MRDRKPAELPLRKDVRPGEEPAFDFMLTRIQGAERVKIGMIGGKPYGVDYFKALANTPVLGEALGRMGKAAMEVPGGENTLSDTDHELIDAVIAFDSGYNWLMGGHAALALKAGVRLEALEAIRKGNETDLTHDERQQVEFTRAVRDGKMTPQLWTGMIDRLGSERGAIEYAFFVLLVFFNHLLANAMGIPDMKESELDEMFARFHKDRPLVSYHEYAQTFGDAAFKVKSDA